MKKQILILSSYPPRKCGLATYSQDLRKALESKFNNNFSINVCALENGKMDRCYPSEVKHVLDITKSKNYIQLADLINNNQNIIAVFLQHEFGLFSGEYGGYLSYLLDNLKKPVITTFHTVLPHPEKKRREIVNAICSKSDKVIVMTDNSSELLQIHYGITAQKVEIIPHGTHIAQWANRSELKEKYGLKNRKVFSTFGLLSQNKNIETALYALSKIKLKHPSALYLILGRTHPEAMKNEGDRYRKFLKDEVSRLDLEDHVKFVNQYLELDELLDYLKLTDVYLFTSKDPNQAVSGTLIYAMASGCPIVATRIPHARELLDSDTGRIIDFENPDQMAKAVLEILENPVQMEAMARNAFHKTRYTAWENVAIQTARIFEPYFQKAFSFNYPEISYAHIQRMTTDTGIIQFSDISIPDIQSGYTLDDNARALIAMVMHYEQFKDKKVLSLIKTYLKFIQNCQQENGLFLNYLDGNNKYSKQNDYVNLEDANGRAIWALGYLLSKGEQLPEHLSILAETSLCFAMTSLDTFHSPRAIAFIIKGLFYYTKKIRNPKVITLINLLANRLLEKHEEVSEENWHWFENYLTYANATLPEAMLYAYLATGKAAYKIIARTTFDFLLSHLFQKNQIKVISNNGWFHKAKTPNEFGEQPIDVSYTIQALNIFFKVFRENSYRQKMDIAFSWFLGNNHLNQIIYNPISGGCYDGLERDGVNLNQGAESTICYLMARLIMEKVRWEEFLASELQPRLTFELNKPKAVDKPFIRLPKVVQPNVEKMHD